VGAEFKWATTPHEPKVGDIVRVPGWFAKHCEAGILAIVVPPAVCGASCDGPWVSVRFLDNDLNGQWESTEYPLSKLEVMSRG